MYSPGIRFVARHLVLTTLTLLGIAAGSVGMSLPPPQHLDAASPDTAINSSLRDIAGGLSSTTPARSSSGENTRRHTLGSVDLNATPSPNTVFRKFQDVQKCRFKARLNKTVDTAVEIACQTAANEFGRPVDDFTTLARQSLVSHNGGRTIGEGDPASPDKPMHAIRETWAKINQPHVVAAEAGYNARRTILGAIAGEKVKYKHANEFLGGTLSRKSFNEAKERRLTALEDGDVSALAGKRKMRSDNLQEKYPMACCRVEQSILERTQPSPNLTKTNHDYRQRGDHIRSDADNSLVCVHPEKCETHRVHYMTGTQQHLYHQCMDDLQVAFSAGRAEIASISRSSFDKMVPFYVVEQSIRSCLCVHCYKAKLITVALYQLWPTLHHGDNSGSGCTCNCGFCSDGACRTFLPFATEKSVHGMGDLSDLLLCEKVFIYRGQNGKDVKAHRSVCVSGHCPTCQRKQAAFFGCPRHQGTTDRRFPSSAATLGACPSAMEGQPGRVKWSMFTSVDAEGRATDARRLAGPQPPDDDDGDWEPRVASDTSRPKKAVATKTGTVDDFTKEFKDIFRRYIPHRRQYHNQRSAFHETLRTLEEGTVVFVFDFQEQLQLIEQDEVQAQHWQHESVTIFPCPIYFKWKGRVWSYSFQVLSDDRTQDHAWVQHVMFKILTEHVPALMRKLGAPAMVLAIFFTDNCAKQFKCRFHFGWLASRAVMVCDTNGESTNVPVHIEHHYFGSCHGKSSSDSEGANTKGVTRHNIINQSWVVQSPRHLCTLLGESMDFMLLEPTEDEAMTFETARTSSRGGDQLLMTKVWGGESRSDERKTLLITKKPNTLLGRKYIFQAAGAISGAVRSACRSEAKAIKVQGCQAISKTVATETPGVLATYTLSCSCELCRDGKTEKCNLFREGIMEAPAEWSRRGSHDDEETPKEREMELVFTRMRSALPYGSVALMRVHPEEYQGQDVVPIFIGRKAPSDYTSSFATDGMFSEGDVMVWIHDVFSHVRGVEYDVPKVLPVDENRAVPLTSLAGLGQGIGGYMERLRGDGTSATRRYRMRPGVIENARSNLVIMSERPQDAFVDFLPEIMKGSDERRAHVRENLFQPGEVVRKGFKAPPQGRNTAWRGLKAIEAAVVDVITSPEERRNRYRLQWRGESRVLALAAVRRDVDEGYLERCERLSSLSS